MDPMDREALSAMSSDLWNSYQVAAALCAAHGAQIDDDLAGDYYLDALCDQD